MPWRSAAPVVLGIDLGTSSVKTVLLDGDGRQLAQGAAAYPVVTDRPGQAETDPEDWWRSTVSAVRQCLSNYPTVPVAIGLSGQMHGLVLADRTGQAVRPAMLWPDSRATRELEIYRRQPSSLTEQLRNPFTAGMTGPMLLWLRAEEPAAYRAARWALQPKDWLRLRLTGRAAAEPSDASATLLYDVAADVWHERLIDALGLDLALFPGLAQSADAVGELTTGAADAFGVDAGTPVVAGAADTAAGILGAGLGPGVLQVSMGTGLQVVTLRSTSSAPANPSVHLYRTAEPQGWYAMGASLNGGNVLDWARRILGADWSELYAAADHDGQDRGPMFLPHLAGERTPHLDSNLRGAWTGLALDTDRVALLHSALEGVALALREAVDALEPTEPGQRAAARRADVTISGGGSTSPPWRQMLADTLDRVVVPATTPASSSRGAALLAARHAGLEGGAFRTDAGHRADDSSLDRAAQPRPDQVARLTARHRQFETAMAAIRTARADQMPVRPGSANLLPQNA